MQKLKSILEREKYKEVLEIIRPKIYEENVDFFTYYYLSLNKKFKSELLSQKFFNNKLEVLKNLLRKEKDIYIKAEILTKISEHPVVSKNTIDFKNIELIFKTMPKIIKEDVLNKPNWYISLFNNLQLKESDKKSFYLSLANMYQCLYKDDIIKQVKSLIEHADKKNVKIESIVPAFEEIISLDEYPSNTQNYLKSKGRFGVLSSYYERKIIEKNLSGVKEDLQDFKKRI